MKSIFLMDTSMWIGYAAVHIIRHVPWVILEATNLVALKIGSVIKRAYIQKVSVSELWTDPECMILEIDSGPWVSANHLVDNVF